jgi:hypothetical protein
MAAQTNFFFSCGAIFGFGDELTGAAGGTVGSVPTAIGATI